MASDTGTYSWTQHHNQNIKHFYSSESSLYCLLQAPTSTDLVSFTVDLHLSFIFYKKELCLFLMLLSISIIKDSSVLLHMSLGHSFLFLNNIHIVDIS